MASNFDDLLQNVPVGDLAKQFDVDENVMLEAVQRAMPGLLGGMAVNASNEEGAASLERATDKHTQHAASLADVDVEDGKKIVKKVLGEKEAPVAQALSKNAGDSVIGDLIPKLLPFLAPLIMQFLAGQLGKGSQPTKKQSSGGITDILGGLLGGSGSQSGGDVFGDVLGGLLGGGSSQKSSGGGLDDLLGGLFGKR